MIQPFDIVVPDLGVELPEIRLTVWLIPTGAEFVAGDRIVELTAGEVSVEISAPDSGRLVEQCAEEHATVTIGQIIGHCEG